ncbi:MAG: hypothetical protein AB1446_08875 [Bacillota bacterium]
MAFPKQPLACIVGVVTLAGLLVGGAWAYPRVAWLGEVPSRLEIAVETVVGTLAGDRLYHTVPPGVYQRGVGPVPSGVNEGGSPVAVGATDIGAGLERLVSQQTEWLLACRTPGGTFAVAPASDLIIPYFANQAAWSLLPEYPGEVRAHLDWYLSHLNRPDRWGLVGTAYDYRIEGDREVPTGSYDSADAYAATFLTAVARYWQVTGDTRFVLDHRSELDLVAGVIVALQDADGLAWARPGHWVKYLMDNAENYQGLSDYAWLLARLGDAESAAYWAARAEAVRQGVRQVMYNPRRGEYYWAIKMSGTRRLPNWRQWYPDAVAQLFPVLCGVEAPDSRISREIYRRFARFYPGWAAVPHPGRSPWGVITPVAVTMGDTGDLQLSLSVAAELPSRAAVWHAGEAACLLSAARQWLSRLFPGGEGSPSVPAPQPEALPHVPDTAAEGGGE